MAHLVVAFLVVPAAFVTPGTAVSRRATPRAVSRMCAATTSVDGQVPLLSVQPSPVLTPREVISSVMAALHKSNWDEPTPYHGFEVALRFLAPTHQAKVNKAKPAGFARFMKQPHKISKILWNESRYDGELVLLISDEVVCGFGRLGAPFGCTAYGFEPDLMTMAKAITSSYAPMGAVAIAPHVADVLAEGSTNSLLMLP